MELVKLHEEKVTTTSLLIAEKFGKRHDNVLRAIKDLECSEEFKLLNFEEAKYKLKRGEAPYYFITRDGFTMLVMSFTGKLAAEFKEAFIKQFNAMEAKLRSAAPTTPNLIPTYQRRILSEPTKECPDNRWNVFDQSHEIMLAVEKHVGSVSQYDLVDGSIGIHWSKYRENKPWIKTVTQYYHQFKDKRGKVMSKCYDYAELEHFKVWLRNIYKKSHLSDYLRAKFKADKIMFAKVITAQPLLIA